MKIKQKSFPSFFFEGLKAAEYFLKLTSSLSFVVLYLSHNQIFLGRRSLRRILCIGDYGPVSNLYASYASSGVNISASSGQLEETLQDLEGREGGVDQPLQSLCNGGTGVSAAGGGAVAPDLVPLTR